MFENLDIFRMSNSMAKHAGHKQAVVAQNVANADTPGYVARDLLPFSDVYEPGSHGQMQRATRAGHLNGGTANAAYTSAELADTQSAPNGNRVSLETEMLKSVDAKRQHDRALAIYKSALGLLRGALRTSG